MQAQRIYKLIEGNVDAQPAIEAVVLLAKSKLDIFDVTLRDRGFTSPGRIDALRVNSGAPAPATTAQPVAVTCTLCQASLHRSSQ